jgi:hypothetical protein
VSPQNKSQLQQEEFRRVWQEEQNDGTFSGQFQGIGELPGIIEDRSAREFARLLESRSDHNSQENLVGVDKQPLAEFVAEFG